MPRLFELTEDNNPNTANRIGFGRAGAAALNMTFVNFLTWLANNLRSASETDEGVIEIATTAETTAGTDDEKAITPLKLEEKLSAGSSLVSNIIDIGDWDMDADEEVFVTHSIADYLKIRSVSVIIRDDADTTFRYRIESVGAAGVTPQGGIVSVNTTSVQLRRLTGGFFDSISFDSTSYNRGYILIESIP